MVIGFSFSDIFADGQINSSGVSLENVSIIEITNNSDKQIKTINVWLTEHSFVSYKSEFGWDSVVTPSDVIQFSTINPLITNETAKFGIVTEKPTSLIYWKAIDSDGEQVGIGKIITTPAPSFVVRTETSPTPLDGITDESEFKIIPKNPHFGSTIRVVGENFTPNMSLDLFLGTLKLKSFETDGNGNFLQTLKIPTSSVPERSNFILKDAQENEKIINVYLTTVEPKFFENTILTVSEISDEFHRTDTIEFSGNANPDIPITILIKNPHQQIFSNVIVNTDSSGYWSSEIDIPYDSVLGTYASEISDGQKTILKSWDVVMSKNISILSNKLKFASGDPITFNGTLAKDVPLNLKLLDPIGNEVFSRNLVSASGFFEIRHMTSDSNVDGTYVLYGFQNEELAVYFIGLNEYPDPPLSIKSKTVHYTSTPITIGITGQPLQDVSLLILDQNGHEMFNDEITLDFDGVKNYHLNYSQFIPGTYTVLASVASSQVSDVFTVGLPSSTKLLDIEMIETNFGSGESLLLTVNSEPNTVANLLLIDPSGVIVNEKQSFVDENGNLLVSDLVVPIDAISGQWIVRAENQNIFDDFYFQVHSSTKEVSFVDVVDISSSASGTFVTIEGTVHSPQTITISINNHNDENIFQTNIRTTENGEFNLLWKPSQEHISENFTVVVEDSFGESFSTFFEIPSSIES